ncbi:MAG: hypothetical protein J6333_01800 [Planctomycetes bacterium]|nr:hypothetical protein [Planctomycetota bacterium]
MQKIAIDQYGRPAWMAECGNEAEAPGAYQIDQTDENRVYLRFQSDAECAIHRITTSGGIVTREWAFGAWDDRVSLAYQEINQTMSIDASKVSHLYAR